MESKLTFEGDAEDFLEYGNLAQLISAHQSLHSYNSRLKNDDNILGKVFDSPICTSCKLPIQGNTFVTLKERKWHKKCMRCSICETKIETRDFISHDQEIFCCPCYDGKFFPRCKKCNVNIKPTTRNERYCLSCSNASDVKH